MRTRIVCHRGACRHAPENTIASALAAVRLGGDIIELDVRQSRDSVLYVLHDATVDRTSNGRGAIAELDSTELDRLDAGSWFAPEFESESLPRLSRFIDALKDKAGLYIEVKNADADAIGRAIRAAGIEQNCFTYSETEIMRAAMTQAAPWLKRMINWRDLDDLDQARQLGCAILEFHAMDLTAERLAAVRRLGLEVMVHTADNEPEIFRQALLERVDYLNIDYPDIVAKMRDELQ